MISARKPGQDVIVEPSILSSDVSGSNNLYEGYNVLIVQKNSSITNGAWQRYT